jgi:hypothetical protein
MWWKFGPQYGGIGRWYGTFKEMDLMGGGQVTGGNAVGRDYSWPLRELVIRSKPGS